MNKSVMVMIAFSVAGMQAMEVDNPNFWSITIGTTKINLIKGFVGDAGDRVRTIVVGRNQQQTLKEPAINDRLMVGETELCKEHTIYKKSEDDESASDDDTYKPFECVKYFDKDEKKKIWKRASKVEVKADVVTIIEPRIRREKVCDSAVGDVVDVPFYYAQRKNPENFHSFFVCEETGDEAIKEASLDLIKCYWNAFLEVGPDQMARDFSAILCGTLLQQEVVSEKEYSVAFQALSTEVGFPRAIAAFTAIKAVRKFINDCPNAYDVVELFVEKRSEFHWYKQYLAMPLEELLAVNNES